jgi:hypothetical protein
VRSISENGPLNPPGAPRLGAYTDEQAGFHAGDEAVEVLHRATASAPSIDGLGLRGLGIGIDVGTSDGMQIDTTTSLLDDDDAEDRPSLSDEASMTPVMGGDHQFAPPPDADVEDPDNWMQLSPREARAAEDYVATIKSQFHEEVDFFDTTMVAEYSDEIFQYMGELEVRRRLMWV